jgi:hypothetical protein
MTQKKKKKLTNLIGNLRSAREHSVQFFLQVFVFTKLNCTVQLSVCGALYASRNLSLKNCNPIARPHREHITCTLN